MTIEGQVACMEASWLEKLESEFKQPYVQELERFLGQEYRSGAVVYPPFPLVFNALCKTPWNGVKVVVIGQDPYHGEGQAHGLSFSVPRGVATPPSLQNIFKEQQADLGLPIPNHGCLDVWAERGVLLLNATLTVRSGQPKSHYGRGWERFTDKIVQLLCERSEPLVFLLWGRSAMEKVPHVGTRHLALSAPHPSPLSAHAGFLGCRHFSKANAFLEQNGLAPIDWRLP